MDDLRPFWAIDPRVIRKMAARLSNNQYDAVAGVHIRKHKIANLTNQCWRSKTMAGVISRFAQHLPDMDIAMNQLDQPRAVVPFDEMQKLLAVELGSRRMLTGAKDRFTKDMEFLLDFENPNPSDKGDDLTDPQWFPHSGKQYMDLARLACPPNSPSRNENMTVADADALYKENLGRLVSNFNLSTDLCTVGPAIQDKHGFLFTASSIVATVRLVPIFSECKTSVNNDILFPANMYSMNDQRYIYDAHHDVEWERKADVLIWRGVTSGGAQNENNWQGMHRQRLVMLTNGTYMSGQEVTILSVHNETKGEYHQFPQFEPSKFATDHFDIGFTESWGCLPDCSFYDGVWTYKPTVKLAKQFRDKFLIDVDGHSFSGRWRAFLLSKSLGIKATIFREWHDSRLFAWRHFVPLDNRYDDLYSIMTSFIGVGNPDNLHTNSNQLQAEPELNADSDSDVYIRRHDLEAKTIALQGRDWANRVLRMEDIEIYMFRLLLEYGRIIDDRRDEVGYSGDGSELDHFDKTHPFYY